MKFFYYYISFTAILLITSLLYANSNTDIPNSFFTIKGAHFKETPKGSFIEIHEFLLSGDQVKSMNVGDDADFNTYNKIVRKSKKLKAQHELTFNFLDNDGGVLEVDSQKIVKGIETNKNISYFAIDTSDIPSGNYKLVVLYRTGGMTSYRKSLSFIDQKVVDEVSVKIIDADKKENIRDIYLSRSKFYDRSDNYPLAIAYAEKVLETSDKNQMGPQRTAYTIASKCYLKIGMCEMALKKHLSLIDANYREYEDSSFSHLNEILKYVKKDKALVIRGDLKESYSENNKIKFVIDKMYERDSGLGTKVIESSMKVKTLPNIQIFSTTP